MHDVETIMPQNYNPHFPNRKKLSLPQFLALFKINVKISVYHIVDTSPSKFFPLGVAVFGIEQKNAPMNISAAEHPTNPPRTACTTLESDELFASLSIR